MSRNYPLLRVVQRMAGVAMSAQRAKDHVENYLGIRASINVCVSILGSGCVESVESKIAYGCDRKPQEKRDRLVNMETKCES